MNTSMKNIVITNNKVLPGQLVVNNFYKYTYKKIINLKNFLKLIIMITFNYLLSLLWTYFMYCKYIKTNTNIKFRSALSTN